MNVLRSFYNTFHLIPGAMTIELFMSPVTPPMGRTGMTLGLLTLCALVYFTTGNPLLSLVVACLLPEVLLRLCLVLC